MAVGNAVVLCDAAGSGPMVTTENFDALRCMNFGQGVLTNPLTAEYVEAEIRRYAPQDAAKVSEQIRNRGRVAHSGEDVGRTVPNGACRVSWNP